MRGGVDAKLTARPAVGDQPTRPGHKLVPVYAEMLTQICRDYRALPDPRTLSMAEIRFFYEALRPELRESTKPRPPPKMPRR